MNRKEFGRRKVVRKHDARQPSEQEREEHEMTSSDSQLVQALHHGERTRRRLPQNGGGREASPRSSF